MSLNKMYPGILFFLRRRKCQFHQVVSKAVIQNYENLVPFCNEEVQPSFSHLRTRAKALVILNLVGVFSFLLAENAVELFTGSERESSGYL